MRTSILPRFCAPLCGAVTVSANTVKTHTQAIYRKLGVSTRRDAVHQGEQAGIL